MSLELAMDGVHPTTVCCLEALQGMTETHRFARILDMGCGSGILSVLAVHWWGAQVVAADIADEAVAHTQALAKEKGLDITAVRSDGFSHPLIGERAPYDLIIFNLLAEVHIRFAPEVKAHLAPGGVCVLSGILRWLEPAVVEAYEGLGFACVERIGHEPWVTLVLKGS